ncbi:hypothetical protein H8B09_28735 [Paenibacillus sp. PR3]|uniref:Uncharacterized protein n=1 Tax=Paenibacillus terricola TaxID=2763503 RepID=A0ABR8N3I7_9BACL|nr:hypothetical protein [Paenibacillus terricola]MBD3922730.1 hypothetical protein [Paenibacillus terricola]
MNGYIRVKSLLAIVILLLYSSCSNPEAPDYNDEDNQGGGKSLVLADLNGDKVNDQASITLEGQNINLQVEVQRAVIKLEGSMLEQDTHPFYEEPSIHLLNEKDSNHKLILVSVLWNTNKIGTKADLWVFTYDETGLVKVWDSNTDGRVELAYTVSDYRDGEVSLEIPRLSLSTRVPIDEAYYEGYLSAHSEGIIEETTTSMYEIRDFDNDNTPELIIEKVVSTGAVEWLPFRRVLEVYQIANDELHLLKVIPRDNIPEQSQ